MVRMPLVCRPIWWKPIIVLGGDSPRAHQSDAFFWATKKEAVRDDGLEIINHITTDPSNPVTKSKREVGNLQWPMYGKRLIEDPQLNLESAIQGSRGPQLRTRTWLSKKMIQHSKQIIVYFSLSVLWV